MQSYPYVSLSKALELADKIYAKEEMRPIRRDSSLAVIIGYGTLNGSSEATLTTMVNYGLLEELEDRYLQVTPMCLRIILNNQSHPERVAAIHEAVSRIEVFEKLKAEFGDRIVPERILLDYFNEQNVKHRTALRTASVYRATIEFVNRETQKAQPSGFGVLRGRTMQTQENVRVTGNASAPRTLYIPLDESNDIRVVFPDERMTIKQLNTLIRHLRFVRDSMRANNSTNEDESTELDGGTYNES